MHVRYLLQFLFSCLFFQNFIFSSQNNHRNFQGTAICVGLPNQPENKSSNQFSDGLNTTQDSSSFFVGSARTDRSGCMQSSSADVSAEQIVKQIVAYILHDACCRKDFHMTAQQHDDLMSCWRYKTFVTKLLAHKDLQEDIAWKLFNEFVKLKTLHGDGLQECKETIRNAFKHKNAEKVRKKNKHLKQEQEAQQLEEQKAKNREIAFIKEQQEAEQLFIESLYDEILPIRASSRCLIKYNEKKH